MLNPFKPWYLYRPGQLVRRAVRAVVPPADPVQTVRLPWGVPLTVDVREAIGRSVWTAGVYELAVAELLYRLTRPADLAVDAGANIGAMTGLLAFRAAEVWAFEPHPAVFARLAANVGRLAGRPGFAPVVLHPAALWSAAGEVRLDEPAGFAGNHGVARVAAGGPTAVPAVTLDEVLAGRPVGVLKLDVEGAEPAVLDGASEAIRNGRVRDVLFEAHDGPDGPAGRRLAATGFTLFAVGWRVRGPVLAPPDRPAHRRYEPPTYLATRDPAAARIAAAPRGWRALGR